MGGYPIYLTLYILWRKIMKNKKQRELSNKEQRVAVNILEIYIGKFGMGNKEEQ